VAAEFPRSGRGGSRPPHRCDHPRGFRTKPRLDVPQCLKRGISRLSCFSAVSVTSCARRYSPNGPVVRSAILWAPTELTAIPVLVAGRSVSSRIAAAVDESGHAIELSGRHAVRRKHADAGDSRCGAVRQGHAPHAPDSGIQQARRLGSSSRCAASGTMTYSALTPGGSARRVVGQVIWTLTRAVARFCRCPVAPSCTAQLRRAR